MTFTRKNHPVGLIAPFSRKTNIAAYNILLVFSDYSNLKLRLFGVGYNTEYVRAANLPSQEHT